FVRGRARKSFLKKGGSKAEVALADELLNPDVLTIGFARRFATYKRAPLIFSDMERIIRLLSDSNRPIQLIFAGKAHPKDNNGKELIRQIIHNLRKEELRRRVVFIEDYDMNVARYLLQGVDVWLNNPRRPLEASGTSGMKAAANGGLNLSVLDGWWCEGYEPDVGWRIGKGEEYADLTYQDDVESRDLYNILEKEIIPCFYTRGKDGLPREWISMMKATFKNLSPVFNTNRMVTDYARKFYLPSLERWNIMKSDDFHGARELTSWKAKVKSNWHEVKVLNSHFSGTTEEIKVGDKVTVNLEVHLGGLSPDDVNVQVLFGKVSPEEELIEPAINTLSMTEPLGDGRWAYSGSITCNESGQHGFSVRLLPFNSALSFGHETGLIRWG
ncbi:alpha-glucan family phosphorylase, partial [Myxococcota bacterium]|nr:alpha-glucan family phosphorylase [Myxococcota bacterium]